ncbi:MAG: hypothetical protein JXN64_12590 [Spirochaetes bacterium]|nr:hypothetical protein [Spirochaetota bacterium]
MDLIGKVIGSRYRVIEKLGSGRMSSVYRTNDLQDNSSIALKVIKIPSSLQRSDALIRFHAEIKALIKKLNRILRAWADYHRHIVALKSFQPC